MSNSRHNNSTEARILYSQIFASGTFKNVFAGTYTSGSRAGQPCVAKEFKAGLVYEEHYFHEEMRVIRRTQMVINDWQRSGRIDKRILLNTPEIWEVSGGRAKVLVEPMIENFVKFNSNSGWVNNSDGVWSDAMQALSHFSYHNSDGRLLLCDLQGGSYRDGFVLTDPVIMSQNQSYGPADLGPAGIKSFFQRHRCGNYCSSGWRQPHSSSAPTVPKRKGTSMVPYLPTRASRNPLSRIQE
ncbi:hypothetical protein NUW58_g731 [Xylaria curta]|uniref:Uncharacterized protein n=1 Tax=Xylaria curta TaxID=42375 RepID=A0ACC1PNP5_9PEZI|nr:hypothetical protein NUW58_g731 [Xylaria curta]